VKAKIKFDYSLNDNFSFLLDKTPWFQTGFCWRITEQRWSTQIKFEQICWNS